MANIKKFSSWRAEQITKIALLDGGFNQVYDNPDHSSDFVAISGRTGNQQFLVDVKDSKTPKRTLAASLKGMRKRSTGKPLILVVVDSERGEGVFKVVSRDKESEALPLRRNELEQVLEGA